MGSRDVLLLCGGHSGSVAEQRGQICLLEPLASSSPPVPSLPPLSGGASRRRYISQDWRGVPSQLDAAMVGRIYVAQSPSKRRSRKRSSRRHRKRYRSRRRWGRWKPSAWKWMGDTSSESMDLDWLLGSPASCQPFQSVYFFLGDKYYRLNLRTHRVDYVYPKYPRKIAKYWLGCPSDADLD